MAKKTYKKVKKPVVTAVEPPRKLKTAQYRSFRLQKKITPKQPKLPSAWKVFVTTAKTIRLHWRLYAGIIGIYAVLAVLLANGLSSEVDLTDIKDTVQETFQGQWFGALTVGVLFGTLITGTGNSASPEAAAYQSFLLITIGLVTIWGLRQRLAGQKVSVKEAFYKGLTPLVPFLLVTMVIGLQLIPLGIGAWLYSIVAANSLAVTLAEKILWLLLLAMLALLSLYMVCSSLFALIIVTLPNMTPMRALKSARKLVLHRRWIVLRRVLFLPLILLILAGVVMVPIIIWATDFAQTVYFLLTVIGWPVMLTYLYILYRELLHE